MKRRSTRVISILLAVLFAFGLAACTNQANTSPKQQPQGEENSNQKQDGNTGSAEKQEMLEIIVFDGRGEGEWVTNPPKEDVVSPAVAEATGVKVKQFFNKQGKPNIDESLFALVNSGNMPDLIYTYTSDSPSKAIEELIKAGKILEITDEIKAKIPNIMAGANPAFFEAKKYKDGKVYSLPVRQAPTPEDMKDPEIARNEWMLAGQPIYVREDILAQLGYKFKSSEELEAKVQRGEWLTYEDMRVEGLETTEDFYQFLKKAKTIKVGNKNMIPLSIEWGELFTIPMFNIPFGFISRFDYDKNGNVMFMTSNPRFKEAMKFTNKLYREGLIDPEFLVQKGEQKISKISSGQVACWWVWGMGTDAGPVRKALQEVNPNYKVRVLNRITAPGITEPRQYNVSFLGGDMVYISKDTDVDRILEFFEWHFTPEGEEIIYWGPKSAGLWEEKNGEKVFKDPELEANRLTGAKVESGKDMSYYGLNGKMALASRVAAKIKSRPTAQRIVGFFQQQRAAANPDNFFDSDLAYFPAPQDVNDFNRKYYGQPPLIQKYFADCLTAKTDEEFEKAFEAGQKGMEAEGVKEAEAAYTQALKEYWERKNK